MHELLPLDDNDLALVLCLEDELLFVLLFWGEELSEEMTVQQKLMTCDRSKKILACTGRKVGKTLLGIEARVIRLGVIHKGVGAGITEAMLFAPRDAQMTPIIDRVYGRINRTPFLKSFVDDMRRGEAPRLSFRTGLIWYARIEGVGGTDQNMVGLRARYIVGDELAYGNWVCHNSRIQTALPDADWWYSGVPNGVRNSPFYQLDQTALGENWSRHKYDTFINPIYKDPKAKEELTRAYGGVDTPGYKTQVLGEWGDEMQSSFPPGAIAIGTQPYFIRHLPTGVRNNDESIALLLGMGAVRAPLFCVGWDYGFSPDPSVLVIACQREEWKWECVARIVMRQVALPIQARVVRYIYQRLLVGSLGAICCDSADAIQTLQANDPQRADRFIRTMPGGMMPIVDELGQPVVEAEEDGKEPKPVTMRVKQYLTEKLRQFMLNANLDLPGQQLKIGNDPDLIEELAGTVERRTQAGYAVYYGPPNPDNPGTMNDHSTDGCRYLSDAILHSIVRADESNDEAALIAAMGWSGKAREGGWTPAWSTPRAGQ